MFNICISLAFLSFKRLNLSSGHLHYIVASSDLQIAHINLTVFNFVDM